LEIVNYGGREGPSRKKIHNQEENIQNLEKHFRIEKKYSESLASDHAGGGVIGR